MPIIHAEISNFSLKRSLIYPSRGPEQLIRCPTSRALRLAGAAENYQRSIKSRYFTFNIDRMSFLGLGGNPAASGNVNPAKVQAAEAELDMVTDMFNRLVDSCHEKCISNSNYAEGPLNKSESLCLDRCVAKYFEVNTKVGEVSILLSKLLKRTPIANNVAHAKDWSQPKLYEISCVVYTSHVKNDIKNHHAKIQKSVQLAS